MSSYYQPISPPWSHHSTPPHLPLDSPQPPRAPVMPYAALPPVDDYYTPPRTYPHSFAAAAAHGATPEQLTNALLFSPVGLVTPPPSPGEIHPTLCARPTVVRYDFAADPRTLRMSSSSHLYPMFPARDAASHPSLGVLHIECEASGHRVTIYPGSGSSSVNDGIDDNDAWQPASRGGRQGRDHGSAVTCYDVFTQLHRFFAQPLRADEWRRVAEPRRSLMKAAYSRRVGRPYDSQYGSPQMRMVDYLLGQTVFLRFVRQAAPGTWLLQTSS